MPASNANTPNSRIGSVSGRAELATAAVTGFDGSGYEGGCDVTGPSLVPPGGERPSQRG